MSHLLLSLLFFSLSLSFLSASLQVRSNSFWMKLNVNRVPSLPCSTTVAIWISSIHSLSFSKWRHKSYDRWNVVLSLSRTPSGLLFVVFRPLTHRSALKFPSKIAITDRNCFSVEGYCCPDNGLFLFCASEMGLRFFRRINYKRAERKILERFRRTARRTVSSVMFYFRASVTRECYPSRDTSQWYRRFSVFSFAYSFLSPCKYLSK